MSDLVERMRDMHALASGACDPEFNRVLLTAADEIERLRAERDQAPGLPWLLEKDLRTEIERLRAALEEIVNPIGAMRREAEANGYRLSGLAYQICNSPAHLQGIAHRALSGINVENEKSC